MLGSILVAEIFLKQSSSLNVVHTNHGTEIEVG